MENRIKKIRKLLGLNQKEFAKSILVSQSYLSELESGKHSPSDMLVRLVSLTHNVSEQWLLAGDGEMFAKSKSFEELCNIADLGGRIRFARENKKLTQKELAKNVNVKLAKIEEFENNSKVPDMDESDLLTLNLEVNSDWLFLNQGDVYFPHKLVLVDPSSQQYDPVTREIISHLCKMDEVKKQEILKYIQKESLLEKLLKKHGSS